MQMSKNVNNDVSMNPPIFGAYIRRLTIYLSRRQWSCWFLISDKAGFMDAVEKAVQALVRNVGSGLMKVSEWLRLNYLSGFMTGYMT